MRQIEIKGVSRTYHPGDCVDVGKQSALRWIIDGSARALAPQKFDAAELKGCGVVLMGDPAPALAAQASRITQYIPTLPITISDAPDLPYARTLIWDTAFPLRPELVPVGFGLLDRWEVAAPLASYDTLAIHIGSEAARQRTAAIIHDLRVPVYDTRLLFVKRCRAGRELLAAWAVERETGDHDGLCFLRALWRVKPLVNALPCTWNKQVPAIA